MEVIIDGYNLLSTSSKFSARPEELLENARNRLIEKLSHYKRHKNASITIVFDGWKDGFFTQSQEISRGIKIIYSKLGEKADEVIKRMIANSLRDVVVVSSDREIRDFAEKHNTISLSSSEFEKKIDMAAYMEMKGSSKEDDSYQENKVSTRKKGNPRRLPRAERKRRAKLRKL